MNKVKRYVEKYLSKEKHDITYIPVSNSQSGLSLDERTLIYKYTEDGYENVNELLRETDGKQNSEYGMLLAQTLAKLPDYEDVVYRCADLSEFQLKKYIEAEANNSTLVEHSFVSASKSKFIAYAYGRKCVFRIYSRTGKAIEEFAKYGLYTAQNEKEILFSPGKKFKVLDITNEADSVLITMEEIR